MAAVLLVLACGDGNGADGGKENGGAEGSPGGISDDPLGNRSRIVSSHPFRFGINHGHRNPGFSDTDQSVLSRDAGATSARIKLPEYHLKRWGLDIELGDMESYVAHGKHDLVAFVLGMTEEHSTAPAGTPDWKRDYYIPDNLHEPIWLDDGTVNPDNYWAAYLYDTMKTYGQYVTYWEIWNEPDWVSDWQVTQEWEDEPPRAEDLPRFNGSIFDYVRMLRIATEGQDTLSAMHPRLAPSLLLPLHFLAFSACSTSSTAPSAASGGSGEPMADGGGDGGAGAHGSGAGEGTFELLFRDDFDILDSSRWRLMTHSWASNLALFSSESVAVDSGELRISLLPAPDGTTDDTGAAKPFLGAEVRSVDTINYGRVRARAKLASGSAVVSSLVTIYTPWPADNWNELDIESLNERARKSIAQKQATNNDIEQSAGFRESLRPLTDRWGRKDYSTIALGHVGKDPTEVQFNAMVYTGLLPAPSKPVSPTQDPTMYALGFDASADFHEYTIEWTPEEARFFVDGVLAHTWTKHIELMNLPQNVLLTIWASSSVAWAGAVDDSTVGASAVYDWIEVYDYVSP